MKRLVGEFMKSLLILICKCYQKARTVTQFGFTSAEPDNKTITVHEVLSMHPTNHLSYLMTTGTNTRLGVGIFLQIGGVQSVQKNHKQQTVNSIMNWWSYYKKFSPCFIIISLLRSIIGLSDKKIMRSNKMFTNTGIKISDCIKISRPLK